MAGFVASPNTVAVKLKWAYSGRAQFNVLHGEYTLAGPLNPNCAENIFTALKASSGWVGGTGLEQYLAPVLTLTGVGVLDLRSPGVPEIASTSAAVAGTGTSSIFPPQIAGVVTLRTALTGRSHRGRVYLFGFTADANASGTIQPTANTAMVNFVTALQTAMTAQSMQMAIRSPALPERPSKPGGTLPAKDYEITIVNKIEARDNIWDTNRRRTDLLHR